MAKEGHVPTWLARRTYFKRIGRWMKSGKARRTGTAPEAAAPLASNVVLFPVRVDRPERPAISGRRSIGMA
jgi:hypothetical protein